MELKSRKVPAKVEMRNPFTNAEITYEKNGVRMTPEEYKELQEQENEMLETYYGYANIIKVPKPSPVINVNGAFVSLTKKLANDNIMKQMEARMWESAFPEPKWFSWKDHINREKTSQEIIDSISPDDKI